MNSSQQTQRKQSEVETLSLNRSHTAPDQSLSLISSDVEDNEISRPAPDSKPLKCLKLDEYRRTSLPLSLMAHGKTFEGRNILIRDSVSLSGSCDDIPSTQVEDRHRFDHPAAIKESEEEKLRRERKRIFQNEKLRQKKSL